MGMTDVGGIPVVTTGGGYGGNDCGMGGGNFIWAFLLFALLGNRGGFGGNGGNGGGAVAAVDNTVWEAQNFQRIETNQNALQNSIQQVGQGLCSSVFSLNNSIKDGQFANAMQTQSGFSGIGNAICATAYEQARQVDGISRQMAECCCTTQRSIDGVQNAITASTCAIGNMFKDAELREAYAKIAEQGSALSEQRIIGAVLQNLQPPRPIPSYSVCNPYTGHTPCF